MKPRPNKSKPDGRPPDRRPLAPGRKWLFRCAALLLPVLVLLIVELCLRVAGQGHSTRFFKELHSDGKTFLVDNANFSLRFFPPELARWPTSVKFESAKPKGTIRIFIFGESAAMGDPQPAFGAGRYLEVLLRERFPQTKFEVINLGITAINSHVILPIARDCARREGDIWIIYMGNNEMVGPFGAATVFGTQAPPLFAVRLTLAILQTRVGQLAMNLARRQAGKSANTSWGGMQMFLQNQVPPGDARKETVYQNFAANLRDIVEVGLNSGAKVVLSTMSVNLRDCPPFTSLANSNLPAADRERFDRILSEGKSLQQETNYVAAAERFSEAANLDPQFAEAHFRWAECLPQTMNVTAQELYQRACDLDALPFRADTRINAVIRQLASSRPNERLALCDMETELARVGTSGVAGAESFYEHVHFNPEGNYRLARAWATQVARFMPEAATPEASASWAPQAVCDQKLGLTVWNRHFLLQSVIRRMGQPPLSTQWNNADRLKAARVEDQELLRRQAEPGAVQRVRGEFQTLLQRAPNDPYLYEGQANFLEAIGDREGAIAAYRRIIELLPHDFYASLQLGRLLGEQGQPAAAQPFLENATRLRPSLPEGWYELGAVLGAQEQFPAALDCIQRAARLRPQDPAYVCYTAKVLAKMQQRAQAIEHYRRAIQMRPDFWEAHFELAGELAFDNQVNEALREYAEVIRINPRHATARVNFGVMLVRVNRLEAAIQQFEEALKIEPANRAAQDYLTQVQARKARKP